MVVSGNEFIENSACCLEADKSIWNLFVKVSHNHFFQNLFNIKCGILENRKRFKIYRNTFEIPSNQKNKTIKFSKKFWNLQFKDNELIILNEKINNEVLYQLFITNSFSKEIEYPSKKLTETDRISLLKKDCID